MCINQWCEILSGIYQSALVSKSNVVKQSHVVVVCGSSLSPTTLVSLVQHFGVVYNSSN